MSETITSIDTRPVAANLLLHLIASLLAPMFLAVAGGDIEFARLAAIETINDYRARDGADLLAVAQIIAFGLAALASLSLSMGDDLSIPMALRLRGNANACDRSAEQNRRARAQGLPTRRPESPPVPESATADEKVAAEDESDLSLSPEAEHFCAAAALGLWHDTGQPSGSGAKRDRELWAIAYTSEASEIEAGLADLPPAKREKALTRAGILRSAANQLLMGAPVTPPGR